jgi:hypothetical protein
MSHHQQLSFVGTASCRPFTLYPRHRLSLHLFPFHSLFIFLSSVQLVLAAFPRRPCLWSASPRRSLHLQLWRRSSPAIVIVGPARLLLSSEDGDGVYRTDGGMRDHRQRQNYSTQPVSFVSHRLYANPVPRQPL